MARLLTFVLIATALAASPVSAAGAGPWLGPAQAQAGSYVIGPQDVLLITVWDQPDITGKYTVEADGSFTFPMIGRVKAGGLTLRELEAELKKRLSPDYLKNPQVSVAVEQYHSQRIFVVGEVRSPGPMPLTGDMTLIEAIARAGSAMPTASGEVLVVRRPAGRNGEAPVLPGEKDATDVITVDLKELQSGKLEGNFALRDGDTIYVPRAETVFVFGQVARPGEYPIQKGTTVLQALSLAGGTTQRAALGRIKIRRRVGGKMTEIGVKLDDVVQPGDTINVPERWF
ncbi:MAG: polysaccharide biosynthesis/export family protein [Vicinamibacterales bacterium]